MPSQRWVRGGLLCAMLLCNSIAWGADWPMLGRDATRNSVSPDSGGPIDWDVGKYDRKTDKWSGGRNIKWIAPLGSLTFGDPVIAGGQIWIGTNNSRAEEPDAPDASVLAGFAIADGKPLYRYVSPRLATGRKHDWPTSAMAGAPLIEGDHMWFVTNRAEVVCLDVKPLKEGKDSPATVWKLDMMKDLGVSPCGSRMALCHFCSIAAYQDLIYVVTGNGVDQNWSDIPAPDAPSLICCDKNTGRVVWKDNSPGVNILSGQWASPLVIPDKEKPQVVVPQGDGWLRSFEPASGKLIWEFDINDKAAKHDYYGRGTKNTILAPPVFYDGRVYIASGDYVEHGEGPGRLVCLDPTKSGDISSQLAVDADGLPLPRRRTEAVIVADGEKALPNPNSGLIWEYTKLDRNSDGKIEFDEEFHRTPSSVAIKDGLLMACDGAGLVHCFDAKTGTLHWTHDLFAYSYTAPLIVDDKAYITDEDGDVAVFRLSATPPLEPLFEANMGASIFTAPIFADGVLYVATRNFLFAIAPTSDDKLPTHMGYWPEWRGPKRDNRSKDVGLLQEWPADGPPLAWRVDGLGSDIASVSVADGRVFTFGYHENSEYLIALREKDGELLWKRRVGPAEPRLSLMRWLSQRCPTLDGDLLYATSSEGICVCLATATGEERWRVSYAEQFAAKKPHWDFCDRPLVDGDRLILAPGSEKAAVVALDKRTGKVVWQAAIENAGMCAHAATVAANFGGVRQYLAFLGKGLVSVRASDGVLLWRYDGNSSATANSYTPLVHNDVVYNPNGYGTGLSALRIEYDSNKKTFDAKQLYHAPRAEFDAFQDATVILEDRLFAVLRDGILMCVDLKNGEKLWHERAGVGKAALSYADGRLYVLHANGRASLVEPGGKKYIERGSFQLPDQKPSIGATLPVVTGGRLYLRTDDILFCFAIRTGEKPPEPRTVKLPPLRDVAAATDTTRPERSPRAVFVPTPHDVVPKMFDLAGFKKGETVVDLGSGDGRIVLAAARRGCMGVGFELDKDLVESSRAEAAKLGLTELAVFEQKDLFQADLSSANIVMLYLLPKQLEALLPKLQKMKPGSRIVAHQYPLPGVEPDKKVDVLSNDGDTHTVYLWTLPLKPAK